MLITKDFYNNALQFSLNIIRKHDKSNFIDKNDIVHDVICDINLNAENWKSLIVSKVYEYKNQKFLYPIDAVPKNKDWIEHRYCKHCDMIMPEDYFISGYNNKTNEYQYRTICRKCHKKTDKVKEAAKKWRLKNREKILLRQKEYRKTHIDKTAKERYLRWKQKHGKIL